jgi:hypothetical protein
MNAFLQIYDDAYSKFLDSLPDDVARLIFLGIVIRNDLAALVGEEKALSIMDRITNGKSPENRIES